MSVARCCPSGGDLVQARQGPAAPCRWPVLQAEAARRRRALKLDLLLATRMIHAHFACNAQGSWSFKPSSERKFTCLPSNTHIRVRWCSPAFACSYVKESTTRGKDICPTVLC
eukprot:6190673-Pleurochrysis_carterae.AAC.2